MRLSRPKAQVLAAAALLIGGAVIAAGACMTRAFAHGSASAGGEAVCSSWGPWRGSAEAARVAQARPAQAGRWREGPALPVRLSEIGAAALDGAIYTGGGFTPPGASIGTWFGRLIVDQERWEALASMPVAVHHPGMTAAAGRVWLAGGYTGQLNVQSATRRLDAYDPANDTWTRMADMPGRRGAHTLIALDGKLYVAGGVGDANREMWVYDIEDDAWSSAPGPTRREHLGGASSGGMLYVIAGRGFGLGDRSGILEAYDPAAGSWERLPDMPGACGGCSAAATSDGRIHITGGETFSPASGGRQTYRDHYVFDPEAGAWSTGVPMPTARHGIGAAALGERFYVVGGGLEAGLDYTTLVEWWAPEGAEPATPTPQASAEPTAVATAGATVTATATASAEPTTAATVEATVTATSEPSSWRLHLPKLCNAFDGA